MRREEKGEKFESWSEKYACKGDFFDETNKGLKYDHSLKAKFLDGNSYARPKFFFLGGSFIKWLEKERNYSTTRKLDLF